MKAKKLTKETILNFDIKENSFPDFSVGDTIVLGQRIKEGDKERIQYFEGDVIAKKGRGITSTFTIRKIGANGIAVERILPYYSEIIKSIKVLRRGKIRRAKLYYLRSRIGKAAKIKEKILTREQKQQKAEANN